MPAALSAEISDRLAAGESIARGDDRSICAVTLPLSPPLCGGRRTIASGQVGDAAPDLTLVAALRKAHAMVGPDGSGHPIVEAAPASAYDKKILRLVFPAPDIQRDILAGHQPRQFDFEKLMRIDIPLAWNRQRAELGLGTC